MAIGLYQISCIIEYPYKFVKVLKSQQLIEKDTVTLACELDDAAGEVKWFKGDEEIKPDKRVKVVKEGRKRKLVIGDAKVTDAGEYSCVSNADKTQAEIVINYNLSNSSKLSTTTASPIMPPRIVPTLKPMSKALDTSGQR